MQRPLVGCPRTDDVAAVERFHDILHAHGYTVEGLVDAVHLAGTTTVEPKGRAALLRRTSGGKPMDTLIRLFIIGTEVELDAVRAAAAPMTPHEWATLGLIAIDRGY